VYRSFTLEQSTFEYLPIPCRRTAAGNLSLYYWDRDMPQNLEILIGILLDSSTGCMESLGQTGFSWADLPL
jgi:hypothetical protein